MRKLLEHLEGDGQVGPDADHLVSVRYCVDTWQESIPLGSGVSGGVRRMDGFVWALEGNFPEGRTQFLHLADGRKLEVRLDSARSGRAMFVALKHSVVTTNSQIS
ncbi:MAG TPA: hypothetical protein VM009_07965 [Terriglobales bacterium]|nr:hypothetical protein [Terriglobales bacterium]